MLKISGLDTAYGDLYVLKDVSISVKKGSITTILGPNAAGKSTLLKTICRLIKPLSGSIWVDGVNIESKKTYEIALLGVAHVPENRRVFPSLTVLENLEVGSYSKEAKKKRKESLEYVFSLFPRLAERRKQRAGTLSGGEQQMLAIGRALMLRPNLLMLDEPSLGLAPIIVNELFKHIKQINKDGTTILLVEQNANASLMVTTEGYIIDQGRIMFSGNKEQLINNEFVKEAYFSKAIS